MAGLETVYAIHHFEAENPDEIAFAVGEPIIVLEKDDGYNDGWWQGRNVKGEIGLFPMNYTSPQQPKKSRSPSIDDSMNKLQLSPSINNNILHQQQLPTPSTSASTTRRSPDLRNNSISSIASSKSQQQQKQHQHAGSSPSRPLTLSKNVHKLLATALALPELKSTLPEDWTVDQVAVWMDAMGFDAVADNFKAQEITGDILLELTLDSLKELEINTFGKRFKIHSAINALREHCKQASCEDRATTTTTPDDTRSNDDTTTSRSLSSPQIAASDYASSTTSDEYPQAARLYTMDSIPSTTPPIHQHHHHHHHPLRGPAAYRHSEESIRSNHSIRPMEQQGLTRSQSMLKQQPQHPSHRQPPNVELSTRSAGRNPSENHSSLPPPASSSSSSTRPMVRNSFSPTSKPQNVVPVASRASMDSLLQRSTQLDVVPDMEGWLHKQGDKYKTWNRRWFVLKGPNLFYFKSPKDVRMKGIINLRGYKIINDETIYAGKYCFKVQHDRERTFYFYTESQRTMKSWMNALMKATIARDYAAPVLSSSTVPTVSLDMARRMKPRPPSMILYKKDEFKGQEQLSPIMDDSPISPYAQQTRESGITDYDDEPHYRPDNNEKSEKRQSPRVSSDDQEPESFKSPSAASLDDSGFQSGPISSILSPPHSSSTSSNSTSNTTTIHHRYHVGSSDEDLIDPQHTSMLTTSRPGGLKRLTEESHLSVNASIWSTTDYIDWLQQNVDRKVTSLSDLRTGDILIELLENLSGKDVRRPPSTANSPANMQMLDNIVAAFKFMGREGVEVDGRYTIKDVFGANESKIKEMLDAIKTWSDTSHNDKKASGGTFGEGNFKGLDQDTTLSSFA